MSVADLILIVVMLSLYAFIATYYAFAQKNLATEYRRRCIWYQDRVPREEIPYDYLITPFHMEPEDLEFINQQEKK